MLIRISPRDLESGRITKEYAQELVDCFFLKICDMFKGRSHFVSQGGGGYTSGQQMSLGGVDKDGNDASNALSYMLLEASARLVLHSPPLSFACMKEYAQKALGGGCRMYKTGWGDSHISRMMILSFR